MTTETMPGAEPPVVPLAGAALDLPGVSRETVGSKAYNLMRMARCGLPVPPGFVVGTAVCRRYFAAGGRLPEGVREELAAGIRRLETANGTQFGGVRRPLLVSVRSGAAVSMPGIMATLLNVGLNETSLRGLIRTTGNPRLAWDCWRRLIRGYAEIVHGVPPARFDRLEEAAITAQPGAPEAVPAAPDTEALQAVAGAAHDAFRALAGAPFPHDPMAQLTGAVEAVLRSWMSAPAVAYRRLNRLEGLAGTAVTVQAMVFGNAGGSSGAGVGFTRDPATGENRLYLDFLPNAQGEDVVSGRFAVGDGGRLARLLPQVHAEILRARTVLEREFRDLQDFEFTVQEGRLFFLQTRAGKRTPWAALKVAIDLVREGLIDPATALERLAGLDPERLERLRLAPPPGTVPLARAVPAGIGVAVGAVACDPERAKALAAAGRPVILVRRDIATEDIAGLAAAEGVLTAAGARTSHGAVVARQLGKVCLVGCRDLAVDPEARCCTLAGRVFGEGDWLSLDGESGEIHAGALPVTRETPTEALAEVARWRQERGAR